MNFPVLCKAFALSNKSLVAAIQHFGNIEEFLEAPIAEIEPFLKPEVFKKVKAWRLSGRLPAAYERINRAVELTQSSILCLGDPQYPSLLAETVDAPAILFVKGEQQNLLLPQIAIVGSRKATAQGQRLGFEFAKSLASAGFAITSGLATGIDSSAHQGALACQGVTCALMGTGLDQIYPARNRGLAGQILQSGGVLATEFLPGSPPRAAHFPQRNRVVTGLSLGVLVVEASERSGSLISARLGAEQGREVFAVPGSVFSPVSAGCNSLIREGATLVTSPEQIVEQLGPMLNFQIEARPQKLVAKKQEGQEKSSLHWLLEKMGFDPVTVDELCELSGRAIQEVNTALTELELDGKVVQTAYGYQRLS